MKKRGRKPEIQQQQFGKQMQKKSNKSKNDKFKDQALSKLFFLKNSNKEENYKISQIFNRVTSPMDLIY